MDKWAEYIYSKLLIFFTDFDVEDELAEKDAYISQLEIQIERQKGIIIGYEDPRFKDKINETNWQEEVYKVQKRGKH